MILFSAMIHAVYQVQVGITNFIHMWLLHLAPKWLGAHLRVLLSPLGVLTPSAGSCPFARWRLARGVRAGRSGWAWRRSWWRRARPRYAASSPRSIGASASAAPGAPPSGTWLQWRTYPEVVNLVRTLELPVQHFTEGLCRVQNLTLS